MRALHYILKVDMAVSMFCLSHRLSLPIALYSKYISRTGDGPLYILIALCAAWLDSSELLIIGCCAFALHLPLYWIVKNTCRRRRPSELNSIINPIIIPSDRFSFPSGHTAAAFLVATLIEHTYPALYLPALLWACMIGLSRVMLGVHFMTDIFVGALLGISVALFTLSYLM